MQMMQLLQKMVAGCGADIIMSYKPNLSDNPGSGVAMVLKRAKAPYKNKN
jgi:hypothetical protein